MKKGSVISFILKSTVYWLVPTLVILSLYLYFDPLHALRLHEEDLSDNFIPNKGLITVSQFELQNPARHYNSFIIGPSLAVNFHIKDWLKYLPSDARPYHFDSSAMTIEQMRKAVEYLHKNAQIKHAILVCNPSSIIKSGNNDGGILYLTPPRMEESRLDALSTHFKFFKHWNSFGCLNGWISQHLLHSDVKGINSFPIDTTVTEYRRDINEESCSNRDNILQALSDSLLHANPELADNGFRPASPKTHEEQVILGKKEDDFMAIASLLNNSDADYYLVIVPERDLKNLHEADMKRLNEIFGNHLIDLTEEMSYITRNPYNYFDHIHFRPVVAREIMRRIYETQER